MKEIIILLLIFFFSSCETRENRFFRIANDRSMYLSASPGVIHLDKECKILKKSDGYKIFQKTVIGSLGWDFNSIEFCTNCCTPNDIEKLKSQVYLYQAENNK